MYGKTDNLDEEIGKFPVSDCVSNVKVKKVEYYKEDAADKKNYECIRIHYHRKVDNVLQVFTEQTLPLNVDTILGWENGSQELVDEKAKEFNAKLLHVAKQYDVTKEELQEKTMANSFAEFAQKYQNLLTPKLDDRLLYMKVMVNGSNYLETPKYPPFLQKMSTGDCTLSYSNYEKGLLAKHKSNVVASSAIVEEDNDDASFEDLLEN